ncbi:MAG TPA: hypothetical protein VG895_01070 [Patescibacteria group bacterium]|nr:hypothetical protein [Patescibacteria group bacterium]
MSAELINVRQNFQYAQVGALKLSDKEKVDELLLVKKETRKRLTRLVNGMRKLVSLDEIKSEMLEKYTHAREVEASVVFLITEENGNEYEDSSDFHLDHDFYLVTDDTNNIFGTANRYAISTPRGRLIVDVHSPKSAKEQEWATEKLNVLATGRYPEGIIKEIL